MNQRRGPPPRTLWVSIATTDRSAGLEALCADLVEQSREAAVSLRFAIVENSVSAAERADNATALGSIATAGVPVHLDDKEPGGGSISRSRRRQREQLRALLMTFPEPTVIWMLDDDNRLLHAVASRDGLKMTPLHNAVGFLMGLAQLHPSVDLLVGEVCGDPPIPAMATLASRYGDLLRLAQALSRMAPEVPWLVGDAALTALERPDHYYDFADTSATADSEAAWLPRSAGATALDVWREACDEAGDLPWGIGFTRPIPAQPKRFDRLTPGNCRGGNAVFFNAETCLAHRYPSLHLAGIQTRRSDMIGSALLARRRPDRVMQSGFSVLHQRPRRNAALPDRASLERLLLSDTFGSALARTVAVDAPPSPERLQGAMQRRVTQIDAALARYNMTLTELSLVLPALPAWMQQAVAPDVTERVHAGMDWARTHVPGAAEGRLPVDLRAELLDHGNAQCLADFAFHLLQDQEAE